MKPINVLLVDDHKVVRSGYRFLLESTDDIRVIGEAESGEEACRLYPQLHADVVVMDLSMPGMGGLEAIHRLHSKDKNVRILVFSVHDDEAFLQRALDAGALGYLTKRSADQSMIEAVRQVAQGQLFIEQSLLPYLVRRGDGERKERFAELTQREFEVMLLLAEGKSVQDIAPILNLSTKTIGNYATSIKAKLQVNNLAELIRLAMKHGLVH